MAIWLKSTVLEEFVELVKSAMFSILIKILFFENGMVDILTVSTTPAS